MNYKKVIFPFYEKDKHLFLLKKWWFRLIIVVYLISFVGGVGVVADDIYQSQIGWCWDTSYLYYADFKASNEHRELCSSLYELPENNPWLRLGYSFLIVLVISYVIQFIFYKVLVNYIILGGKTKD